MTQMRFPEFPAFGGLSDFRIKRPIALALALITCACVAPDIAAQYIMAPAGSAGTARASIGINQSNFATQAQLSNLDTLVRTVDNRVTNPVGLGLNQTWRNFRYLSETCQWVSEYDYVCTQPTPTSDTRQAGVWYQNTTGAPIALSLWLERGASRDLAVGPSTSSYIWITQADGASGEWGQLIVTIPKDHYYYYPSGSVRQWAELR